MHQEDGVCVLQDRCRLAGLYQQQSQVLSSQRPNVLLLKLLHPILRVHNGRLRVDRYCLNRS